MSMENFTDEDLDVMATAYLLVMALISNVNESDKEEAKAGLEETISAADSPDPLIREIGKRISERFSRYKTTLQRLHQKFREGDGSQYLSRCGGYIRYAVKTIQEKGSPGQVQAYQQAVMQMARKIAEASGGDQSGKSAVDQRENKMLGYLAFALDIPKEQSV